MTAGVAVATLIGLGVWQLERHERKQALVAELAGALGRDSAPLSLAEAEAAMASDASRDHLLVKTTGTFLHGAERYLFAVSNGEPGWHVITPLETTVDNRLVLVDRGFVPSALRWPDARPGGQPHGAVAVEGLLRPQRARGMFTPSNEPHHNIWYWADVSALLASLSPPAGRSPSPYLLTALPGADIPGEAWPSAERPDLAGIPNNHRGYAATWFALAAALAAIAVRLLGARFRRRHDPGRHFS